MRGKGREGHAYSISGASVTYATGGGGGGNVSGIGGSGGSGIVVIRYRFQ